MTTALAVLAAALIVARLIMLARLHIVGSAYHPVHHAVSDYAVGATRGLSVLMSRTAALAWVVLAGATWLGLPDWSYRGMATGMLALAGGLTLLMERFPTDLEGQRLTRTGIIHYVLAIATFALTYSLTGDLSRLAAARPGWSVYAPILSVLHVVALVALIGVVVTLVPRLRTVFGLVERVFLVSIALFYLTYAVALAVAH